MKKALWNFMVTRDTRTERHKSYKKQIYTSYATWNVEIKLTLGGGAEYKMKPRHEKDSRHANNLCSFLCLIPSGLPGHPLFHV